MYTNYFNCQIDNLIEFKNESFNIKSILENTDRSIETKEVYKIMKHKNYNFGNQIKSIKDFYYGDEECIIKLIPKSNKNFKIHPIYLDSCLCASIIYLSYTNENTYIPN